MKKIKSKNVLNYVMNDMVFKVDMPRLLKEIAECSKSTPYSVTFTILTLIGALEAHCYYLFRANAIIALAVITLLGFVITFGIVVIKEN